MTGYKMNFATKTLTITKAFEAKAMFPNSDEANLLMNMRNLFPDLKIAYKTCYRSKPNSNKGLSYKKMETYIKFHENADELLVAFNGIKKIAKSQSFPYSYVCQWFFAQFPYYKEIPTLNNDKIAAVKVITLPRGTEKSKEEMFEELAA